MANYIDSNGGLFDSVAVGGGIRSNGDVTTKYGSINNSRQVLRCESGNTITVKYPSKTANMGSAVLPFALDSIRIYMSYTGYGGGTYDQSLKFLYGADVKGYFSLTSSTINKRR